MKRCPQLPNRIVSASFAKASVAKAFCTSNLEIIVYDDLLWVLYFTFCVIKQFWRISAVFYRQKSSSKHQCSWDHPFPFFFVVVWDWASKIFMYRVRVILQLWVNLCKHCLRITLLNYISVVIFPFMMFWVTPQLDLNSPMEETKPGYLPQPLLEAQLMRPV